MSHPCRHDREQKAKREITNAAVAEQKFKEVKQTHQAKRKEPKDILSLVPVVDQYKDFWIRQPQDWVSKSYNIERQKRDFISWLFCKYRAPLFLYKEFENPDLLQPNHWLNPILKFRSSLAITWFIEISQGEPFARNSAKYFTKKEASWFTKGLKDLSTEENMWWAKFMTRGFKPAIAKIIATVLEPRTDHLVFNPARASYQLMTKDLPDFLGRYKDDPMLDTNTLRDLLDYLATLQYTPEFSFKNRTLNSIIQLSNRWHAGQVKRRSGFVAKWEGVPTEKFVHHDKEDNSVWEIIQLTSSKELYDEGQKMHHCVGGYAELCANGTYSIFSMRKEVKGTTTRQATIQITNKSRAVVQARGPCNRALTVKENNIMARWAQQAGVKLRMF